MFTIIFANEVRTNLFYLIQMINNYAQIRPKYDHNLRTLSIFCWNAFDLSYEYLPWLVKD